MISLPQYAPGPGVNLADLGTPKRELVPMLELVVNAGKEAMLNRAGRRSRKTGAARCCRKV